MQLGMHWGKLPAKKPLSMLKSGSEKMRQKWELDMVEPFLLQAKAPPLPPNYCLDASIRCKLRHLGAKACGYSMGCRASHGVSLSIPSFYYRHGLLNLF